ncbi:HD domain-containing phosphohydrolase [Clostridium sp.]|uniref:sensor domain-containing diguanylate cyclase/phosphohydrolase n=1 Tax=Clostridium sp. TaxID=1506 RepID=UPI003217BD34
MNLGELCLQSMPWPIWIEDMDTRILFLNKPYEKLFNVDFLRVKGKTNIEVFPLKVAELYNDQIRICLEKMTTCTYENIINNRMKQCHMFPIADEDGQVKFVGGIIVDIEDEMQKEIELKYQKNILRTIIDSLPEAIFYKDKECKYIGYNKNFEDYYKNFGVNEIMGKTDLDIHPDRSIAEKFIIEDKSIMKSKKAKYIEGVTFDKYGNKMDEESFKVPVIDENGETLGIVGLARDITPTKKLEEKLRYLSYTDSLTGLYNRTYFEEKIEELNKEEFLPLGIIMGDVNGLKLVNDSLGHFEGDNLLKSIANVLKNVCGDKGFVCRWGGDEFMILMPNCNDNSCEKVVEDILDKCKNNDYKYIELSIALGDVVKYTLEDDTYKYIKEVEERVYRQKLLKKNSVRSSMMNSLKKSLEVKNMETEEHTERIEQYALEVGNRLGFKNSEMDELVIVARLHDIGKIAIEEDILLKPGPLTDEEFEIMKTHTEKGYRIINASSELVNVAKCVLTHHERWDGKGYPLGIEGQEIPLMARVISMVDAYDVMTNGGVYKKAMSKEESIKELKRCSGTQFDPSLVKLFLEYLEEVE